MKIQETATNVSLKIDRLTMFVYSQTHKTPFVLFENSEDVEVYELPIGYIVDKHSFYIQGAIQKVQRNKVTLFLTGEKYGNKKESQTN